MTSLTSHTPAVNANAMLFTSSANALSKKATPSKKYISYAFVQKNISRKSTVKVFLMDWDLNMNELEFE